MLHILSQTKVLSLETKMLSRRANEIKLGYAMHPPGKTVNRSHNRSFAKQGFSRFVLKTSKFHDVGGH
jgi:hypothetical protein